MEIKNKISLQILWTISVVLIISYSAIYISFAGFRVDDFYSRLENKALSVGRMLMEIDEIDARLLGKIEKNDPSKLYNEQILIFNTSDSLIFSSAAKPSIKIESVLLAVLDGEIPFRQRQKNLEIFGVHYKVENEYFKIFIGAEDIYGLRKLRMLRIIIGITLVLSLLVIFIASRILASKAIKPIRKVIGQVGVIEASNLNARVDGGSGSDEIAMLAAAFNKMLSNLEASFGAQKDFIANASHELKTPLTVITGQVEVALKQHRTEKEYREILGSILQETRSLSLLFNRLLLLAQASSSSESAEFINIRIDEVLWHAREELKRRNPDFSVHIELTSTVDDEKYLIVCGNEMLLRSALINLMENGCKFSDEQHVRVNVSRDKGSLILHFIDEGDGINPDEIAKIFIPFYRTTAAKKKNGYGIGLPLVEKIISLHKGSISVKSEVGKGSDFLVTLPLAKLQE